MNKLVNLLVVAVLAAFGWVNVVYAHDFGDPLPSCGVADNLPGFHADVILVFWSDVGADAYSVALVCMDPNTGRSKSAIYETGGPGVGVIVGLSQFNGWQSFKEGDVCMVAVKGLHTDGTPNNSVVGKADCAGELVD